MVQRYQMRLAADGWTVYDVWTGQPVKFEGCWQTGLGYQSAELTANLLNWRVKEGDRKVFQ